LRSGIDSLKNRGLRSFLLESWGFLFKYEKLLVYEFNLNKDLRPIQSLPNLVLKKGELKDLKEILERERNTLAEFTRYYVDGVSNFYLAYLDQQLANITWIYLMKDKNRFLKLKPNEAEMKYGVTLPAFRGRNIAPKVYEAILTQLKKDGFESVYGVIREDNLPSCRAVEKLGFREKNRLTHIKFLGIQISPRPR